MKVRTLISDLLQDIGYLGVGDDLQDEDAQYVLRLLNEWIDALALEPLTMYALARTTTALAAGVGTLTIGTGGAIALVRPMAIDHAGLIVDTSAVPPVELPVEVLTPQRWEDEPLKTLTGPLVRRVYYDKNWVAGLAQITLWPIPTVATTTLVLYTLQALTTFATLDTEYALPPGYQRFFRTNGRAVAADGFNRPLTARQEAEARTAKGLLKRANERVTEARFDPRLPGVRAGGGYDWRPDEYRPG